jgi:hypothetical protein
VFGHKPPPFLRHCSSQGCPSYQLLPTEHSTSHTPGWVTALPLPTNLFSKIPWAWISL